MHRLSLEQPRLVAIKPRVIRQRLDDEDVLIELANLLSHGRIRRLLGLLTDDVVISEPFSKAQTLCGKSEALDFLRLASLFFRNMKCEFHICSCQHSVWRQISAVFMFSEDASCRIFVTIKLGGYDPADPDCSRIRSLDIAFSG